jgi:predicted SnoaL-like aldol condensation-catalyzing enzyme
MGRWLCVTISALTLAACGGSATSDLAAAPPAAASRAPPPGPVVAGVQSPVVGHPEPLAQLASPDASLARNKRLVFDMWRSIVNGGHVELADALLTEGYIQHSPLLPTGRAAFRQIFSVVPRLDEIPELVSPPLVALVAERDLVVMSLVETLQEPDGTGTYTSTHFNLFRIENGRLAEHWHSVQGPPGPDVLPPEEGGPQRVTGVSGSDQLALLEAEDPALARNKRLVFDMYRTVVDAGSEDMADRFFDGAYIEHSPVGGSGREALASRLGDVEDRRLESSIRMPLVALVAEGDLVVLVGMLEHAHPSRRGDTYTSTWFDMYRIADGRIVEHWDGSSKAASGTGADATPGP